MVDAKWFGAGIPPADKVAPWQPAFLNTNIMYPDETGEINYQLNSLGYRDTEWTNENLNNSIWCVGHSDVFGIGISLEDTWCKQLASTSGIDTINLGIAGASWDTIARTIVCGLKTHKPKFIAIQATTKDRREYITNDRQQIVLPNMDGDRQVDLNFWKFVDEENSQYSLEKNITIIELACKAAGVEYIIFDFYDRWDTIKKYPAVDGQHIGIVPHKEIAAYISAELKKRQFD